MSEAPPTSSPALPPIDFWEDRLEIRAADLLAASAAPGFIANWLERRSAAEVSVLRALVGLPINANKKGRAAELLQYADDVRRFVPVAAFGSYKSMLATLEVAEACVSEQLRRLGVSGDGTHHTTALLFAIYDHSWEELEKVFFLDKLHRVGFARMRLRRAPRHPAHTLLEFLRAEDLKDVLRRFDEDQRDGRRCLVRGVLERQGGLLVYIRRPHRENQLLVGGRLVHGHDPDWIVLEFRDEGRLLNVASHGKRASFAIANRIASAFYGQRCEYVNSSEDTYRAQLQEFLKRLGADEDPQLTMVAVRLREPPLPSLALLDGANEANVSVGPGILELERLLNVRLLDGERVERLTLVYKEKRVRLQIERSENSPPKEPRYVVRYKDRDLNLGERPEFEDLIERQYGFRIVSTEKRKSRAR